MKGRKAFSLGRIFMTRGVYNKALEDNDFWIFVGNSLTRHANCDWGEVCEEDWESNTEAVKNGDRIISAYTYKGNTKIWIITEADRSATTILFPDEY